MNKTLKILLAVLLFAVVLTIATNVSAAVPDVVTSSEIEAYLDSDGKLAEELKTLKVNNNLTLDLNGKSVTTAIEILENGSLTLKNTDTATPATSTVKLVDVKSKGSFTVDMTNITITDPVKNAGSVDLTKGTIGSLVNEKGNVILAKNTVLTTLETNSNLTFDNKVSITNVKVTEDTATVIIKDNTVATADVKTTGSDASIVLGNVKGEASNQIITSYENLTVTTVLKDKDGKVATGAEKGEYAIVPKVMYNGNTEMALAASFAVKNATDPEVSDYVEIDGTMTLPNETTSYTKLVVKKAVGDKTFKLIPTVATKALAEVTIPTNNKPDENKPDENKPAEDNKPDENKPAEDNKPADENKGQLDPDSPDTGDHIIPATALLAVVVVANVVYFAKMKRN